MSQSKSMRRTALGILAALATILALSAAFGMIYWFIEESSVSLLLDYVWFAALYGGFVGSLTVMALGIPCHIALTKLTMLSLTYYLVGSIFISALIGLILIWLQFQEVAGCPKCKFFDTQFTIVMIAVFVSAPMTAFVFWRIVRPDRIH